MGHRSSDGRGKWIGLALVCIAVACGPAAQSPIGADASTSDAGSDVDSAAGSGAADSSAGSGGADSSAGSGGADGSTTSVTVSATRGIGALTDSLSTSGQRLYGVATSGSVTAVLYADWRARGDDIYLSRIASDGTVLDPRGILLYTGSRAGMDIEASDNGFLVVWAPSKEEAGTPVSREVKAVFVPSAANQQPGPPITLELAGTDAVGSPRVAYDGSRLVAVWDHWTPVPGNGGDGGAPPDLKWKLQATRFDANGVALDSQPFSLYGVAGGLLAGGPGNLLLISTEGGTTKTVRLLTDNGVVAESPVTLPPTAGYPYQLVWGQGTYLLTMIGSGTVLAERLGPNGALIDSAPMVVGSELSPQGAQIRAAFVGSGFRVNWGAWTAQDGYFNRSVDISEDGVISGSPFDTPAASQLAWTWDSVDLRAIGTTYGQIPRVFEAQLALPLAPDPITHVSNAQTELHLTSGQGHLLACWTDATDDNRTVMLASLTGPQGDLTEWTAQAQSVALTPDFASPIGVEGPNGALLAWLDADMSTFTATAKATRLSSTGQALDEPPLVLGAVTVAGGQGTFLSGSSLSAAADSNDFLVAYDVAWANANGKRRVCATHVSPGGTVTPSGCVDTQGSEVPLDPEPYAINPAVAALGDSHVVAWSAYDISTFRIYGKRVLPGGSLAGKATLLSDSTTYDNAFQPSAASDGTTALVAWQSRGSGPEYPTWVYAATFDGASLHKGAFRVADDSAVTGVKAAFDGAQYWIVWLDGVAPARVRAVRLDLTGNVIAGPDTLGDDALPGDIVAGAAVDVQHFVVGYTAFDSTLGSMRSRLRTVMLSP